VRKWVNIKNRLCLIKLLGVEWFESAVGAHLLNSSLSRNMNLYYWRENILEVDFILEKNGELIAVEVKSNGVAEFRGLEAFKKMYGPKKMILVGEKGIPVHEFLELNPNDLF
jgi:predicted AAA+ superfamily ATPase